MVPINVIIKNYKSYGDEETTIDLSGNSVKLIYGNIGAGKTTFVDGIIWCLYGESLVNVDEVINRRNKKNCKVEFNFSIGKDIYSIIRFRKHEEYGNDLIIFENQKNISPIKKRDSQELINSIIGMNHKAMISSVMFSSEIYISFLRVREAKRLEIFDSVLNMNVFKKWYDTTRKKRAPLEEEFNVASNNIDKLEYGKSTILQNIEEYKNRAKAQLVELKRKRATSEEKIEKLKSEILKYEDVNVVEEIKAAEEYQKVKLHNSPIEEQVDALKREFEKTTEDLHKLSLKYNTNKEDLEELEGLDIDKEQQKIKVKEKNEEILHQIELLNGKIVSLEEIERSIEKNLKEVEAINKKKEGLKKSVCFTCGQEINKEITENIKKELSREESTLLKKVRAKKESLSSQKELNRVVSNQIEKLRDEIKEVGRVLSQEEIQNMLERKTTLKSDISWQEKEFGELSARKKEAEKNLNEKKGLLVPKIEPSKYSLDFLNNIKDIQEKKESEIEALKSEVKSINNQAKSVYDKSYIEELESKIKKIEVKLEEANKTREKKQKEIFYYNYLLKMLSNKDYGIKKYIISKMIDVFNKNINKYIPLFFQRDIVVEFDRNLKETILENKQEISFNSFSSGEKSLLDISIAFSLYMLVKDFFSSDIRFLVFDEILDRNLDEDGIQSILQVINELAKENSIMVISHRVELQESFDQRIHVYKEDGFSKIESS